MSDVGGDSGHVNFAALLRAGIGNEKDAGERKTIKHGWVGKKGDLTIELHYGDFDTGHGRQAALYLFRGDESKGVYVPLSTLWMYTEREALHVMIPPLAAQLYGFVTQQDQVRVLDAVLEYFEDLQKSPPDPLLFKDRSLDAFRESCAQEGLEVFVDVNGKRLH